MIPRAYTIPASSEHSDIGIFSVKKGNCRVCGEEFTGPPNRKYCTKHSMPHGKAKAKAKAKTRTISAV